MTFQHQRMSPGRGPIVALPREQPAGVPHWLTNDLSRILVDDQGIGVECCADMGNVHAHVWSSMMHQHRYVLKRGDGDGFGNGEGLGSGEGDGTFGEGGLGLGEGTLGDGTFGLGDGDLAAVAVFGGDGEGTLTTMGDDFGEGFGGDSWAEHTLANRSNSMCRHRRCLRTRMVADDLDSGLLIVTVVCKLFCSANLAVKRFYLVNDDVRPTTKSSHRCINPCK